MKNILKILLLYCLLFLPLSNKAQTILQDYIDAEEVRIQQADSINNQIEIFISNNLSSYTLTQSEIDDVTNDLFNLHDGSNTSIIGNDLNDALLLVKTNKIRELYYQQNPNDVLLFEPIPVPIELRQQCINGGFENGIVNYSFRERVINPSAHFIPSCNNQGSLPTSFTPFGLNNFNNNATLVTAGNDEPEPHLASLGININRVLTGNMAIKLNPTPVNQPNSQIGNRTSISRDFIINENQIEFSFLQFGHVVSSTNNGHHRPYFRYQLIDIATGTELASNCYNLSTTDCRYAQIPDNTYGNNLLSYTQNWICERINTSNFIGMNVRLEFSASDCGFRGHFSTVYIDNICGVSCTPDWGNLSIDPLNINCPTSNFDLCGSFDLPNGSSLTSLSLNIIDSANNIVNTLTNQVINGNNYCFTIDMSNLGTPPTGSYTFDVTLNNNSNCNITSQLTETGGNVTFNNCLNPCDIIVTGSFINGTILCWDDITDGDYEIQFISSSDCPNKGPSTQTFMNYTQNSNCIDLGDVLRDLNRKCFRWRIRTDCSDWSDWCLLGAGSTSIDPPFVSFGDCIPSNPCENFDATINLTSPNNDILSGTTNYDTYIDITASNVVSNGATSTYQASNSITLIPGFHANNGSAFIAKIIPCNPAITPPPPNSNRQAVIEDLKVYPNPATNKLTLVTKEFKINSLELYNIYGKLISRNQKVNINEYTIDVGNLTRGYYILKVQLEDNSIIYRNIILK